MKFILLFLTIIMNFSPIMADSRMYVDEDEFQIKEDSFYIHIGNNVWLETNTVHKDCTGLFAYEGNICRRNINLNGDYERKWKCPYCYMYWPIGRACQNKDCASRYQ